jgi:hypothetical protein
MQPAVREGAVYGQCGDLCGRLLPAVFTPEQQLQSAKKSRAEHRPENPNE